VNRQAGETSTNGATWTTRLSYTGSEVAGQLIFCVVSFYLLKFYTDVYGISAAAAGAILLVARCVDAVDAPIWGLLFEKTRSRWGKSRPWFLWLCVPFALFGVLTFVTPAFSPGGKIVYATLTYVCCSILYTGINTPVTSILASLTPDPNERVLLTSYRMFGSKLGVLFVNLTLLVFVKVLGHGNQRLGFTLVMPIYALGSIALYLFAFRNLREILPEQHSNASARRSWLALKQNGPWFAIFLSSLLFWIAFIARISSAPYFFEYVLHRPELTSVANSMDFVSLGSVLFLPQLCRRFSKSRVWAAGLLGSVAGQVLLYAGAARGSVAVVLAGWLLGFLASGLAMAIPFSILSESVDYGEWKSGVRAAGLLTALGAAFCLKAGSGLGGALPAWILARSHYVPNREQVVSAIHGIECSFIWLPALAYLLAAVPALFYGRYEALEPKIRQELEERRRLSALVSESA
jgi:sugar (glycoside-pentoside-hexuronide) transporter